VTAIRKLQGKSRWVDHGKISDLGVEQIYFEIRDDDDAHPDDVRAMMVRALAELQSGKPLHKGISAFLSLGLTRYLNGSLSLERAFGLAKAGRGRPRVPMGKQVSIALAVIELYISTNQTLEMAAAEAGKRFRQGKTQALKALYATGTSACTGVRILRKRKNPKQPLSLDEDRRIRNLYRRIKAANRRSQEKTPE
jgi:hypothetical protein